MLYLQLQKVHISIELILYSLIVKHANKNTITHIFDEQQEVPISLEEFRFY